MLEQYNQILMIGSGLTGRSVESALKRHGKNVELITAEDDAEWAALEEMVYDSNVDLIVVSPGVRINHLLDKFRSMGISVLSDVELFCELVDVPVIAITGTNGKTTCAHWLARVLQNYGNATVVGNAGIPVFDIYDHVDEYDWIIIEVSSFQLYHSTKLSVKLACILNLESDHLDWHPNLEHYHRSKWRISRHAESMVVHESLKKDQNWMAFGVNEDAKLIESMKQVDLWSAISPVDQLNSLAVSKMLTTLGCVSDMKVVLENTPRLRHRMEHVSDSEHWLWINDSKATNFSAVKSCLDAVKESYPNHMVIWLVGGVFKEAVPKNLTKHVDKVMGFGQDGALVSSDYYTKLTELLDVLYRFWLDNGDKPTVVCFSPGGASFDQFNNYQERGDFFTEWVQKVVESA